MLMCAVCVAHTAEAATDTLVSPTINTLGELSDANGCPGSGGSIMGIRTYKGTYPDRSDLQYQNPFPGYNQTCAVYYDSHSFGVTIENYWTDSTATSSAGDYWSEFTTNGIAFTSTDWTLDNYYFTWKTDGFSSFSILSSSGPGTTPAPKDVQIIQPEYGSTTATTTFDIQIRWHTAFSLDFRPTTTETYQIYDAVTGELEQTSRRVVAPNVSYTVTRDYIATTSPGSKFLRASFYDEAGLIPYSNVDEVFFNVATNTYFAATGLLSPRDATSASEFSQIDCSLFDVGCQFQKVIVYLFYPKKGSLDRFSSVWQSISDKKPFGYIFVTIGELESLTATGTPAFTMPTVPFMDAIFTPLKLGIETLLWGIFAIYWAKQRLFKLDI